MNRKSLTIYYCARCRMTTPHEAVGDDFKCGRCGSVKSVSAAQVHASKSSRCYDRGTEAPKFMLEQPGDTNRSSEVHWN